MPPVAAHGHVVYRVDLLFGNEVGEQGVRAGLMIGPSSGGPLRRRSKLGPGTVGILGVDPLRRCFCHMSSFFSPER